jgi:hypothetical protein
LRSFVVVAFMRVAVCRQLKKKHVCQVNEKPCNPGHASVVKMPMIPLTRTRTACNQTIDIPMQCRREKKDEFRCTHPGVEWLKTALKKGIHISIIGVVRKSCMNPHQK